MISAVIETAQNERDLARTLTVLVPAAVDGVLRDVAVVADTDAADAVRSVCEHAGCELVSAANLRDTIAVRRSDWVLCLQAGAVLEPGWSEALRVHALGTSQAVRFTRSHIAPRPFLERLTGLERGIALGLFITKKQALLLANREATVDGLARRAGTRRINATIVPFSGD